MTRPLPAALALLLAATALALPAAAGPLSLDLPRLDWPQGGVTPSTKGCAAAPAPATCPPRG
jgi:hypothetical protein